VTVPTPADGNWTQAILGRIDRSIKVVAVSPSHWTNGARIDLQPIGKACRDIGAMFVVDASQSLGAVPFSIAQIQPDFLAAAAYKWLLCPYGFAVLYVSERWRNARPLEESWLARERAEDFANLARYSDTYMAGARRFDGGQKCSSTILPGTIAALEQIQAWGIENIAATAAATNATIAGHLQRLGFKVPAEARRSPHMFGAQLPDTYQGNIVAELRKRDIYISQRGNSLRFSSHLHVDAHDVDRLVRALDELVG
jgi:selenocysteine lyase/cysteine desulfurase